MLAVLSGLAAGALHVFSGPDHLAAGAPLAQGGQRRSWLAGFLWGVGHTSGFWLVGLLALGFKEAMDWQRLGLWGEALASLGVAGVGAWALCRGSRGAGQNLRPDLARMACLLGCLHGLSGSTHYLGVLPALAFASVLEGALYLAGFGAGTIASMVAFTWSWGRALEGASRRGRFLERGLRLGSGAVALCVGGWWFCA